MASGGNERPSTVTQPALNQPSTVSQSAINQPSTVPQTYWEREKQKGTTPLIGEKPIHRCRLLSFSDKFSLVLLSLFNYMDTITDILVTIYMLKTGSYILGAISIPTLLYIGSTLPCVLGDNKQGRVMAVLSIFTFSSTQCYAYSELLCHPKPKLFTRRPNSVQHISMSKLRSTLNAAIYLEKITQNQVQLPLQLIFIAQNLGSLTTEDWKIWDYIMLLSFILTITSLTRTYTSFDFYRHERYPWLFSFYPMGKSPVIFYPQYLHLLLVHFSVIVSRVLTLCYMIIIVNHFFAEGSLSRACSLGSLVKTVGSDPNCGFVVRVGFLIFLYRLVFFGIISVIALPRCLFLVRRGIIQLWSDRSVDIRRKIQETLALLHYPYKVVSSQKNFTATLALSNHLTNAKFFTFLVKICPSLLHLTGTAVFAILFFYLLSEKYTQIDGEFDYRYLALIGLGVDLVHLLALVTWVFWADPQHIRSLTDEKILDLMMKMKKIPARINVTCARNAGDVIRYVISRDKDFNVNKEMIGEKIVELNHLSLNLPADSSLLHQLVSKLKQVALDKYVVKKEGEMKYRRLTEDIEQGFVLVS